MVPSPLAQTEGPTLSPADAPDHPAAWTDGRDWIEWKRECALARCNPATQHRLTQFAAHHFNRWLERYRPPSPAGSPGRVEGREAWHRLETHWVTCRGRSGKCYKDWLFAREPSGPDTPLPLVAGGARLLLRDVARDYIRTELAPASTLSFDAPIRPGSSLTWNDLLPGGDLPDPARAAEMRDLETRATKCADQEFRALTRPARIAWLARELGHSLAASAVVRAAGTSKSTLFRELNHSIRRIAIRAAGQSDGVSSTALDLSLQATRLLRRRIRAWGSREKSCAPLCRGAGGFRDPARSLREKCT